MKCRTDWYQADRSVRCSPIDFRMLFANLYIHRKIVSREYMVYHMFFDIYNLYHTMRKRVQCWITYKNNCYRCISLSWAILSYEFYVKLYVHIYINYYARIWIDIFHWIEKFPRYDMEKAHIQSTMNRII